MPALSVCTKMDIARETSRMSKSSMYTEPQCCWNNRDAWEQLAQMEYFSTTDLLMSISTWIILWFKLLFSVNWSCWMEFSVIYVLLAGVTSRAVITILLFLRLFCIRDVMNPLYLDDQKKYWKAILWQTCVWIINILRMLSCVIAGRFSRQLPKHNG